MADMVFTDPPYGVSIGDKNKALNSVQKAGRCCENIKNDTLGDEHYCDVIITRWEKLTGQKASKLE